MFKEKRINTTVVDIDYHATQNFFDGRGTADFVNPLSATMYQDNQPELVSKRDIAEKKTLLGHISNALPRGVLELGCGIGRWSWILSTQSQNIKYLGIDFSSSLIEKAIALAQEKQVHNAQFQVMSVTALQDDALLLAPPFDLIIISGLMLYLNDVDCQAVLNSAARLCSNQGRIYLREPLATEDRLTLRDFYSEDLKQSYSAIYRTVSEMELMIDTALPSTSFSRLQWSSPFGDELANRKETQQLYTLISRRSDA